MLATLQPKILTALLKINQLNCAICLAAAPQKKLSVSFAACFYIDVSILSVCNCIGRLVCGVVGDWALMRHSIPRPVVFGWFIWMMVLAMGLLAIGTVPGEDSVCVCARMCMPASRAIQLIFMCPAQRCTQQP